MSCSRSDLGSTAATENTLSTLRTASPFRGGGRDGGDSATIEWEHCPNSRGFGMTLRCRGVGGRGDLRPRGPPGCSESRTKPATSPSCCPPCSGPLAPGDRRRPTAQPTGPPRSQPGWPRRWSGGPPRRPAHIRSRCPDAGPSTSRPPGDSVHLLTYFYNWAFSHVGTTYSLKWDGDMLLTEEGEPGLHRPRLATRQGEASGGST